MFYDHMILANTNENPAPKDSPKVRKNAMIVPAVSVCSGGTRFGPNIMHKLPRYPLLSDSKKFSMTGAKSLLK